MKASATFALLQSLALLAESSPAPYSLFPKYKSLAAASGDMVYDCTDFPDICTNMCYGAYCVTDGTNELTWDKASSKVKRARRKSAGCIDNQKPGNNRCSAKRGPQGVNCDEFPFASTKPQCNNGQENRVSRCVPVQQNNKQGGKISKFYQTQCSNKAPCDYKVMFTQTTGLQHCNGNCQQDPNEYESGSHPIIDIALPPGTSSLAQTNGTSCPVSPPSNGTTFTGATTFLTDKGMEVSSPKGGVIGRKVVKVAPIDLAKWKHDTDNHKYDPDGDESQFDYMLSNLKTEDHYLVRKIN